jgi:sporulation protein YlmC with PRC-barrel domain
MMKRTLTAAALATALAAPAFAQQADTAPKSSVGMGGHGGFVQQQAANDWRGTKLIGASVYGPDNTSIGEISDVLIANDGKIKAVVVSIGAFIGVTEKDVALPFEALRITPQTGSSSIAKITVSYSKDQLKNAPTFAFNGEPSPSQTTGSGVK